MGAHAVLRNCRLADGRQVSVHVEGGLVSSLDGRPEPAPEGAEVHDLQGWLVLPAMAEPHAHLDKALTAERVPNPTGDLRGAIQAWNAAADAGVFTHDDIVERATRAMELLLISGVTAVRTHVNVGGEIGASSVLALQEARARFEGMLDVQIAALTNSPMTGDGSAANLAALESALEAGVDLVGGGPHHEPDPAAMIAQALRLATDAGVGIDLHVDETLDPGVLTLRELARQVRDRGFGGPVAASHCVSLGMQPEAVQADVAREVAAAGIAVFPQPQTNLFLQGRDDPTATPRGLTAIAALRQAGVLVAAGADNVQDPFNLVGRSDPLETAALLVMAGHVLPEDAYNMVSEAPRRALGLPPAGLTVGARADLVAVDAPSVRAAVADAPRSRRTIHGGRLVASTDESASVHR